MPHFSSSGSWNFEISWTWHYNHNLIKTPFNLICHMNFCAFMRIFIHVLASSELKLLNFQKWILNPYSGWHFFNLIHHMVFFNFSTFSAPHLLSPTPLLYQGSISKTIRFCRVKVWTHKPSFYEHRFVHSKAIMIQSPNRQTDRRQMVELKLRTFFACSIHLTSGNLF